MMSSVLASRRGQRDAMAEKQKEGKVVGNAEEIARYTLVGYKFSSTWDSPEAFARYVASLKEKEAWHKAGWRTGDAEWSGSKSMDETLKMARDGWKEGADQVERLRAKIEASTPQAPRMIRYGIAGVNPSVPRAVAGNLFNMRVPDQSRSRKRPVITIVSNMAANCGVSAHQITNRAAAVAAIIDKIESVGYACEVISTSTTKGGGWWGGSDNDYTAATSVVVKRSDQPVDTMRLAFGLGHSSLFRRMVFADWGVEPTAQNGLGEGLGRHCDMFIPKDEDHDIKGVYTLSSAEQNGCYFDTEERSMVDGLNYLMGQLKEQGCPALKNIEVPPCLTDEAWEKKDGKKKKKKGIPLPIPN